MPQQPPFDQNGPNKPPFYPEGGFPNPMPQQPLPTQGYAPGYQGRGGINMAPDFSGGGVGAPDFSVAGSDGMFGRRVIPKYDPYRSEGPSGWKW
jgi:hypothetical protein